MERGEIAQGDPEVLAWALMGIGELIGMRYILWDGREQVPEAVLAEIGRIVDCVLTPGAGSAPLAGGNA